MCRFLSTFAFVACSCLLATSPVLAQGPGVPPAAPGRQLNWAEQMFDRMNHEFGVVARGADVVLQLKVTNKYKETIHIAEAHTSCNCIAARVLNSTLKSWETGIIEV